MADKLHISVICGGCSSEHDISLLSATNILNALDRNKYEVSIIYIDLTGQWFRIQIEEAKEGCLSDWVRLPQLCEPLICTLEGGGNGYPWQSRDNPNRRFKVDCVFPIVHGTSGEDGALQGFLEMLHLPYVGADVQSSAYCIGKDITKSLLRLAGVPVLDWAVVHPWESLEGRYQTVAKQFGNSLFVKAANLGSSIASQPVNDETTFKKAVQQAFYFDDRVIIEPRVRAREIECAILGGKTPKAAALGEIILNVDYYSYEAKYLLSNAAITKTPVDLSPELSEKIKETAIRAFTTVHAVGMARIDFFLMTDGNFFINEINTIPGFTAISLYPKMWESSGLSCPLLVDELINIALERHTKQKSLIRRYLPDE